MDQLSQSLFDPDFDSLTTAKSPVAGKDMIQASANNFYSGITLADLRSFPERFRLNSRVVKEHGKLVEGGLIGPTPALPNGGTIRYTRT